MSGVDPPERRMFGETTITKLAMKTALLGLLGIVVAGCPTYEDEYTGHFREVLEGERLECFDRRSCSALAVDFFRFGDFAEVVVREYSKGLRNTVDEPFVEETRCVGTQADRFDSNDRDFNLLVDQQANERSVLRGRVDEDGLTLDLEILRPSVVVDVPENFQGNLTLRLERAEGENPSIGCDTINDYVLAANIGSELPEEMNYLIQSPVFAVVWVGFERFDGAGGTVFFPTRSAPQPWWRFLEGTIVAGGRGLDGNVNLQLSPPEDKFLTRSGTTRYSLAHLMVVDDVNRDNLERFNWETDSEPLIATAFRNGLPADSDLELENPRTGKALLFVEGELDELDLATQDLFTNLEDYEFVDSHYFVVDIVADGDDIRAITLPEERRPPTPFLRVTANYLENRTFDLPRLRSF